MVLEIKPTAENIETSVTRPSAFLGEPTRQSLDENLLAQFPQNIADVLFRVTFRDQVDRRLLNQLMQAEIAAGWIGRAASPERAASASQRLPIDSA
jgi:hypothetical protein